MTPVRRWMTLVAALVSTAVYVWITVLSSKFAYDSNKQDRPLILVICLFALLSLLYLVACWLLRNLDGWKTAIGWVLIPAALFRGIILFSEPIQEVDIYRYLWDGATQRVGVSPYKTAPLAAWPPAWIKARWRESARQAQAQVSAEELQALGELRDSDGGLKEVLHRIHFVHIRTVYPPVSQWGFRIVDALTPTHCSSRSRVALMRIWLVLCDLGTLIVVLKIISRVGMPLGLSALYGWCPLVVKEIANSGHLDSMAILLTTLGIYGLVRFWQTDDSSFGSSLAWVVFSALLLGLGIAAKVYPVVLVPWFTLAVIKRRGWVWAALATLLLVACAYAALRPMLIEEARVQRDERAAGGLATFAQYWEMNDFLFLIVIENLKSRANLPQKDIAWFSLLPESIRNRIVSGVYDQLPEALRTNPKNAPFMVARVLTGIAYLVTVWIILGSVWGSDELRRWLSAAFLMIAWFFLWGPTQNPWYWTWVIPLLPFTRLYSWWTLSGLLFMYYLRFWFDYHRSGVPVAGTVYEGDTYFHLVVTWLEFAPWYALLVSEWIARCRSAGPIWQAGMSVTRGTAEPEATN